MIARVFFFLLGFGFSVIGCTYIIVYLNLFSMGYTFIDYLMFITKRPECVIAIIGFLMMVCAIFKGGDKVDICLRHNP